MNKALSVGKKEQAKANRVQRILREICAIILWIFIFTKVVLFDVDVYLVETYTPSLRWLINYRFFGLLILISTMLIAIGKKPLRKFLLYIIAYPFIILFWKFPKLISRNWALAIAFTPFLAEAMTHFRFRFVFTSIAALSIICIIHAYNPYVLGAAMIFLGAYLISHLYRNLKRAYGSGMFQRLVDIVKKMRAKLESGEEQLWKMVDCDPDSEKARKEYEDQLNSFYLINSLIDIIAEKLYVVAKTRKFNIYLIALLFWTFFITSFIYALEYWAVYKINPESFSADNGVTFWTFLGLSFDKLTASNISSINPVSTMAIVLCYTERFCILIILVVLVFSLFTVAREKYKEDIAEFIEELKKLGSEAQVQFSRHYDMLLNDVETAIFNKQAKMVNWLRKAKGLPVLPLPTKDDQESG